MLSKSRTPEYKVWQNIKERCFNPNNCNYNKYGGRGIGMNPKWVENFDNFIHDMGWRPSDGHQINRIDNDGDYEPDNCNWVLQSENMRNTRATRNLSIFGETKSMVEWSEDSRCFVSYRTLAQRISRGWDSEKALVTSTKEYRGR